MPPTPRPPAPARPTATRAPATAASPRQQRTTLGGTNFLTLMLAQLKNQDPTSPVDSNTFLTQLAQLSEVQGITLAQHLVQRVVELV